MSFSFPPPRPKQQPAAPHAAPEIEPVPELVPEPVPEPVTDRRRPRLLLGAARHGLALYRRDRDLPRLLARSDGLRPLDALTETEARCEAARRTGAATYSFARHIEVLIALLAERQLVPRP